MAKHTMFTLLLGIEVSLNSQACHRPPAEQIVTPDQQIALATDVSVARLIRATPTALLTPGGRAPVDYEFEVQQRLLGFPQSRFILAGAQGETRPRPLSEDHSDAEFWERGGGRLYNDPDCVLRPDFIVREYYLIFRRKPATWRSFEHIETAHRRPNPNDRWLSFVNEKLRDR